MHAVQRLVHNDTSAMLLARVQQQLPHDPVHAAGLMTDHLKYFDRVEVNAGPLHHAGRLQADDVTDELDLCAIIFVVTVQWYGWHEINGV